MRQLKIAVVLTLAVLLQSSLGYIWHPLVYIDLPLVVVVYFALQRDMLQALVIGALAGLAMDALSGGLLGAWGFSKTLTAYVIAALSMRVMLDNPLGEFPSWQARRCWTLPSTFCSIACSANLPRSRSSRWSPMS